MKSSGIAESGNLADRMNKNNSFVTSPVTRNGLEQLNVPQNNNLLLSGAGGMLKPSQGFYANRQSAHLK